MYSKLLVILLTLCLWSMMGLAVAGELAVKAPNAGPDGSYLPSSNRDLAVISCQWPGFFGSVASQEDVEFPFEAWVADEFTVLGDEAIQVVQWWGKFWGLPFELVQPDAFIISFFAYDGSCDPGLPPVLLYEYYSTDYTVTDLENDYFEYMANIPPMLVDAGTTYWISIQASMPYSTHGQWGVDGTFDTSDCPALNLFPELGVEYWTSLNGDMAFCLYYDSENPVATETSNWGSVKSLYR